MVDHKFKFIYNCSYSSKFNYLSESKNINLKIKAVLIVVGIIATATVAALAFKLAITYIPVESITKIVAGLVIGILLYTGYSIILSKLAIDERYKTGLKKILDKKFD
jgi:hypothetical protein